MPLLSLIHYRGRTSVNINKREQQTISTFTLVPWWETSQWNSTLHGMDEPPGTGTTQQSFKPPMTGNKPQWCLQLLLPSKWFYHFLYYHITPLMSACHSIRSYSPLKSVFGKIGDMYQSYCNTYKMHAMATCHGGIGCPLDRHHPEQRNPRKCRTWNSEHTWLWCHNCFTWIRGDWTPQRSWV